MLKKGLTETDIRTKFITPAIVGSDGGKWEVMTRRPELGVDECGHHPGTNWENEARLIIRTELARQGLRS